MPDYSPERIAALQAMYTPRAGHSTYSAMSAREREFNDFIMNPLSWIGLGAVRAGASRLAGNRLWRLLGSAKRPINTMYARGFGFRGPSKLAQRILTVRKKGNTLLLGYSLLNPLENLTYAQRRDWEKLIVNYHLPIVGVPIWNQLTDSSGIGAPAGRDPIRTTTSSKKGGEHIPRTWYGKTPSTAGSSYNRSRPSESKHRKGPRPARYRGRTRSQCPPGHYWSKRYKKCVRYRKY